MYFESFVAWILWQLISIVQAQYCAINHDCMPPKKCCIDKCCYVLHIQDESENDGVHVNNSFSYYGRLNIWNMWYFWFIVLFILITCFGVCGYWRRRQFALSAHHQQTFTSHSIRNARMGLVPETSYVRRPNHFMSPLVSGNLSRDYVQPPPYSEVVLKSSMYPVVSENAMKDDLPPYTLEEYQYYMCDENSVCQSAEAVHQPDSSEENKTDEMPIVERSMDSPQNHPQVVLPINPPSYPGLETETQSSVLPIRH